MQNLLNQSDIRSLFWNARILSRLVHHQMQGNSLKLEIPIHDAISRVRFAPHSNNIIIASWDSKLRLFDVDSCVLRIEAPMEVSLLDCCFEDEFTAYGAALNGSILRCDLHSGLNNTIGNHGDLVTCVEYSSETRQIISGGWDNVIMIWDARDRTASTCSKHTGAEVISMSISGYNAVIATGKSVITYDLRNLGMDFQIKEVWPSLQVRCVCAIPGDYKGYAIGTVDGKVALEMPHSSISENIGYTFRCSPKSIRGKYHLVTVNDILFNPTISGVFLTGDNEGYVTAWNAHSRRRLFELTQYPNSVASLSYNKDGKLLAVASSYTYQEANEIQEPPQVFIHQTDSSQTDRVTTTF